MPDSKLPKNQGTRKNGSVSLHPLSFDEALTDLLRTPPPPKQTKKTPKDKPPKSEPK